MTAEAIIRRLEGQAMIGERLPIEARRLISQAPQAPPGLAALHAQRASMYATIAAVARAHAVVAPAHAAIAPAMRAPFPPALAALDETVQRIAEAEAGVHPLVVETWEAEVASAERPR